MAFSSNALVLIGPPNGAVGTTVPRLWVYYSADALATIVAADYFVENPQRLKVGDFVHIKGITNGIRTVTTASTTAVTVSALA